MAKSKSMHGTGRVATRKNMHTDRQSNGLYCHAVNKKLGFGQANWGKAGDELEIPPIDSYDPAYDSADELFERAFGGRPRNTQYDWSAVQDLSDEDEAAMDEIEAAMEEAFLSQLEQESTEVEDEGEAFFD